MTPEHAARPLSGRVIAITGGASGIGHATATLAAQSGASVAVLDANRAAASIAVDLLAGGPHLALHADVTDPESTRLAVHAAIERLGDIDGLVTSAGLALPGDIRSLDTTALHRTFEVNVFGVVHAVQAALPSMSARGTGSIVTLASVAAHRGGGLFGGTAYASSKAAVIGLTRGLARDLAPAGIRVNAVAPGPVDTPILAQAGREQRQRIADSTLLQRLATPAEIAAPIVFLLTAEAAYITGEVFNVNGGVHFS